MAQFARGGEAPIKESPILPNMRMAMHVSDGQPNRYRTFWAATHGQGLTWYTASGQLPGNSVFS